jgi:hypothetical protein
MGDILPGLSDFCSRLENGDTLLAVKSFNLCSDPDLDSSVSMWIRVQEKIETCFVLDALSGGLKRIVELQSPAWRSSSNKKDFLKQSISLFTYIYIFAFKFTLRYLQPDINPIVCRRYR